MDRIGNGYIGATGTACSTKEVILQAEGTAVTTNTSTTGFDVSNYKEALLFLDVTAVSGTTPTLNLFVDTYDFNSAKWFQHPVSIAQINSVSTVLVQLTNFGEQVRLRAVVGGTTPSFTFGASIVAKS